MASSRREGGAALNEQPVSDAAADVITLDHVHKVFGDFTAVQDANFSIRSGEFFSLLGPSGCGKTTMLRMIAGFEQPSSGRMLLDGNDVSQDAAVQAQRQHRVPAIRAVPAHVGVRQRRVRAPESQGTRTPELDQRVNEMLDVVRLGEFAHRRPSQLSGGQQQRVALARALVNLPERAAPRRAARRARPEAAPGHAARAQADPARGRHHVRLRDPRPGRGADDERPHRGHERGPGRADRHPRGDLRRAGAASSSPASSAPPTCCLARSPPRESDRRRRCRLAVRSDQSSAGASSSRCRSAPTPR